MTSASPEIAEIAKQLAVQVLDYDKWNQDLSGPCVVDRVAALLADALIVQREAGRQEVDELRVSIENLNRFYVMARQRAESAEADVLRLRRALETLLVMADPANEEDIPASFWAECRVCQCEVGWPCESTEGWPAEPICHTCVVKEALGLSEIREGG